MGADIAVRIVLGRQDIQEKRLFFALYRFAGTPAGEAATAPAERPAAP